MLLTLAASSASAQPLQVDPRATGCSNESGAPFCDIAAAVARAPEGATVKLAAGAYELWQETIHVRRSLTLRGAGPDATVLDGGGQAPDALVAIAESAAEVRIESLTLENRVRAGAAFLGGGAVDHAGGTLLLSKVHIRGSQGGFGGALHAHSDFEAVELRDVIIQGNAAMASGGIALRNSPLAEARISSSTIDGNSAVFSGGGVFIREVGEVLMEDVTLTSNESGNRGGGLFVMAEGSEIRLDLRQCRVTGNASKATGGIDASGEGIEIRLEGVELIGNVSHEAPANGDCGTEAPGIFRSGGGNRVGVAEGCAFPAAESDRTGTWTAPG
jgi:hypothetical protein